MSGRLLHTWRNIYIFQFSLVLLWLWLENIWNWTFPQAQIRYLTSVPEPLSYIRKFHVADTNAGQQSVYGPCVSTRQEGLSGFTLHTAADLGIPLGANVPHTLFLQFHVISLSLFPFCLGSLEFLLPRSTHECLAYSYQPGAVNELLAAAEPCLPCQTTES